MATKNWQVNFEMNDAKITQSWNGNFVTLGNKYTVIPVDWAKVIKPGETFQKTGFCAQKLGANYRPTNVTVKSL